MPLHPDFNAQCSRQRAAVERTEPELQRAYRLGISQLLRLATANFVASQPALIAAAPPEEPTPIWMMPDLDQLFTSEEGAEVLEMRTRAARKKMTSAATGVWQHELEPVARNRITATIEYLLGYRITEEAQHVRDHAGVILRQGLDDGWSMQRTARELRASIPQFSLSRSTLIARTEMVGASNAGSLGVAKALGAASHKKWLARVDSKTRETHLEANGQVRPLDLPFDVGGSQLQYPGAEGAPAREVCNCRCTIIYEEDPVKPITAAGQAAANRAAREKALADLPTEFKFPGVVQFVTTGPTTNAEGEESGQTEWAGLLAPIGEPTDDGRILDPAEAGAIGWRELPLSLMAQFATQPGHDGAVIAGRIDTITEGAAAFANWSGSGFLGTGVFDDAPGEAGSDDGRKAARLSRDGMLRGVSVDMAADEVELRTSENEAIEDDDEEAWLEAMFGGGLLAVVRGNLLGATMTPFPAFAEANIAVAAPVVVASLAHMAALLASSAAPAPEGVLVRELAVELQASVPNRILPGLTLDRALALGALVASGLASLNEVRNGYLELARVTGGDVLRETVGPAPQTPDVNPIIAAALAQIAANSSTPALPASAGLAVVTDPAPLRRLRVIRDESGQAVGYEETLTNG